MEVGHDSREDWQITVAIYCQNAVEYLRLAGLTGASATAHEAAYKTGNIERWAREHARMQIEKANEKAGGLDCVIPSIATDLSAKLRAMGLAENVIITGTARAEKAVSAQKIGGNNQ